MPTTRRAESSPRAQAAALALLLAAAGPLSAQQTFTDEDFFFSMEIPEGMVQLTDEQRAANQGVPVAQIANRPRGNSTTIELTHDWIWLDPPGADERRRQVELYLMDELRLEWRSEDDFEKWLEAGGVTVTRRETFPRPLRGLIVEGTFANSEGLPLNLITLLLPRWGGYALLRLQCATESFAEVEPEFRASIDSIRFRLPLEPSPSMRNPYEQIEKAVRPGLDSSEWGRLPVSGSFVLAALIVGALVLGGRAKP